MCLEIFRKKITKIKCWLFVRKKYVKEQISSSENALSKLNVEVNNLTRFLEKVKKHRYHENDICVTKFIY